MSATLALPVILSAVLTMSNWKLAIVSMVMVLPVVNMSLLLPQQNPSLEWQKWTGVNLSSGIKDPVIDQAQKIVNEVKRTGQNVTIFSLALNMVDADFQAVALNANYAVRPMPKISFLRPVDWQRPSTFRKDEMVSADYWIFEPVNDPKIVASKLNTFAVADFDQETMLFQAWASQLTTSEGVTVVSNSTNARVLRVNDNTPLESAFDQLVKNHSWRVAFIKANPKSRLGINELASELSLYPPSLENVNFGDIFHLRAFSVSQTGNQVTTRFWWEAYVAFIGT